MKRRTEQQNASIAMMQEWWSDNGQRPYSSWLIDRLNSVIDHEVESLPGLLQRFEGMPRMQAVYRRRPARWRHSLSAATFDALCARLTDAPQYVRPYILGLIGHCDHPKRTEFIAGFLQQSDEDLQQAAIEILGPENAKDYAADILRILTTSQDSLLLENTIETAGQFDDPTLIAPIAAHLPSQDPYVRDAAQTAVRRLLFNHSAQIEKLSHSYKDKLVRQQLANILNVRKAEKESDELLNRQMGNQERLSLAYRLLLSNDREARRQAIELIRRHDLAELLPICADLLPTADQTTRSRIASLLTHKGIPDLTVARAEELFGYSLELDQRMALYCHAQYGDEALPLVRKVAFQWRDPAKPETVEVGRRTKDLITILRNAGEPNLDQRIVAMIREFIDIDRALSYGYLLSTLGHETPTDFIDDLLADESRHKRSHAIWLTCRLGLEQYADQLAQLAPSLYCERPYVVATLIDFGHPQAWPATVSLLDSYALRLGHGNICGPPPDTAFQFGLKLADLKPSHKQQLLQTFQSELEGKKNEGILIALTAALVRDPDAADREWLLQLASKQEVPLSVRTLAAIALSRLGDPSCLPHLQRLLRSYSSGQSNHADAYNARARLGTDEFNAYQTARADVYALDRRLMQRRRSEPWRIFTETPTEYADVVHALHTLGDESMAAELADALIAPDGDWNEQAYALLLQLKGMEGYRAACNRIEAVAPDMLDLWTRVPRDFVGVDMTPVEAMQILTFKETQLYDEALLIIKNNLKQAADPLVELYERCNNNGTPHTDYRSTILDALCQLGDRRGLDLAVDNPLLFLEMATYLADPPVPAIYHQGFKFNNIQTAVTIRDWYLQHRDQLVWNQSTSSFCLAPISPGSREGAGLN